MCARNLFQSCRNVIEECGTAGSCSGIVTDRFLELSDVSAVTGWSLSAVDSCLTVLELFLVSASGPLPILDAFLTIVEVSLTVSGDLLTAIDLLVAVGSSTVPTMFDVSSFITIGVVLAAVCGALSTTGETPEPTSSIRVGFSGSYIS